MPRKKGVKSCFLLFLLGTPLGGGREPAAKWVKENKGVKSCFLLFSCHKTKVQVLFLAFFADFSLRLITL